MPSEPSARESKKVIARTGTAIDTVAEMLTIGTRHDWKRKHSNPRPKTAAEAQKYAALRLQAAQIILRLRFGTKSHGPMKEVARDDAKDEISQYAAMSDDKFDAFMADSIASGELTEEEAVEFREKVRTHNGTKGLAEDEEEDI